MRLRAAGLPPTTSAPGALPAAAAAAAPVHLPPLCGLCLCLHVLHPPVPPPTLQGTDIDTKWPSYLDQFAAWLAAAFPRAAPRLVNKAQSGSTSNIFDACAEAMVPKDADIVVVVSRGLWRASWGGHGAAPPAAALPGLLPGRPPLRPCCAAARRPVPPTAAAFRVERWRLRLRPALPAGVCHERRHAGGLRQGRLGHRARPRLL